MPEFDGSSTQAEAVEAISSQVQGRTFVITGASQPSIGSQLAATLAQAAPAHIEIASRSLGKVEPVLQTIRSTDGSIRTTFVPVDLSDHASVRRAAAEILAAAPAIDVLVNSAGNMALAEYTLDRQGIEMQFSVNHVGHFLLTNLLVPALQRAGAAAKSHGAGARVVNLTSGAYLVSPVRFADHNFSGGAAYQRWTAYGQAKTANILFAHALCRRLHHQNITSTAAHPGYNGDTGLAGHLSWADVSEIEPVALANTGRAFVWEEPRLKTFTQIRRDAAGRGARPGVARPVAGVPAERAGGAVRRVGVRRGECRQALGVEREACRPGVPVLSWGCIVLAHGSVSVG